MHFLFHFFRPYVAALVAAFLIDRLTSVNSDNMYVPRGERSQQEKILLTLIVVLVKKKLVIGASIPVDDILWRTIAPSAHCALLKYLSKRQLDFSEQHF